MEAQNIISIEDCCVFYHIETTFIQSLENHGLLAIKRVDKSEYLDQDDLSLLEKLMHFHYDMNINMEGMEAITHLLEKVNSMRSEMLQLQNRLSRYE